MVWRRNDPEGNEAAKICHMIVPWTRGRGLDLGCGPYKAFPHFIGFDDHSEYQGVAYRPDIRGDVRDLGMFADGSLDFCFSSHLLEHLDDTEAALAEWWRVIRPGGHLVLYLPDRDLYPNIGEEGANPDHRHDFDRQAVIDVMTGVGSWDLIENQQRSGWNEYSFYQVYRKITGTHHRHSWKTAGLPALRAKGRVVLVTRYGAYGDHIQASSVLPGLKQQGWTVVYNCDPRGEELMKADPHIDMLWPQDTGQIPEQELTPYWLQLGREFDHHINLSGSVEATLLAQPGNPNHRVSKQARHLLMNINYLDYQHAIADVPPPHRTRFYATPAESAAARKWRAEMRAEPVILWALAGSSVHKVWPWTYQALTRLLTCTDARVVLVGGRNEQEIEHGVAADLAHMLTGLGEADAEALNLEQLVLRLREHWGSNRLICTSGGWSIRETYARLETVDCIVGPETGVLNAASLLDVPKVVLLSHSSPDNLTRDWVNTIALEPQGVDCWPCHQLHTGFEFCREDPEMPEIALCQSSISCDAVLQAITSCIAQRRAAA
jgi:predicted SAM-dependent methyltransferase/ADP-heptose:LPS heptosyltransferase